MTKQGSSSSTPIRLVPNQISCLAQPDMACLQSRNSLASTVALPNWPIPIAALTNGYYRLDLPTSPDLDLKWTDGYHDIAQPILHPL